MAMWVAVSYLGELEGCRCESIAVHHQLGLHDGLATPFPAEHHALQRSADGQLHTKSNKINR